MSVRIYFSNGSIRNTTLSCIHYTVSKTGGVISLARWDSETNSNITVGEIEFRLLEKHRIRVGQDGEWQLMKDFLSKDEETVMSRYFSHSRLKKIYANGPCLFLTDPIGPDPSLPIMEFITGGERGGQTCL
jgi:hypothetical protein